MPRPTIAVLNGPNLDLLGEREPDVYGTETLADVERRCRDVADEAGFDLDFRQSNAEGALIDAVHEWRRTVAGLVINAAAYSHTSIALHDALLSVRAPIVEVHISNVFRREPFRHHSYVSGVATAVIVGAGTHGYQLAIGHLAELARDGG